MSAPYIALAVVTAVVLGWWIGRNIRRAFSDRPTPTPEGAEWRVMRACDATYDALVEWENTLLDEGNIARAYKVADARELINQLRDRAAGIL